MRLLDAISHGDAIMRHQRLRWEVAALFDAAVNLVEAVRREDGDPLPIVGRVNDERFADEEVMLELIRALAVLKAKDGPRHKLAGPRSPPCRILVG